MYVFVGCVCGCRLGKNVVYICVHAYGFSDYVHFIYALHKENTQTACVCKYMCMSVYVHVYATLCECA
ncbi:hypothetical protein EON63_07695 [archaeon]|nr:MAG: hypothetical protein EON63_07695 [archaeon]